MTLLFPAHSPVLAPTVDGTAFPVRRIFCVGRNYADHAREMGSDPTREAPFFFTKWAEDLLPDGATLPYPQATQNLHHEVELVVALGSGGRDVAEADAMSCVWGYAVGLDMTRRDLQNEAKAHGRPWDAGKNFGGAAPLGLLHPVSALPDLAGRRIALSVNGSVRQQSELGAMIWSVPELIARLSGLYPLGAGDLIYTGTPAGVGAAVAGDRLLAEIDGLTPLAIEIG